MIGRDFLRHVAAALQKMPWIMVIAHVFIRLLQPKYTIGVVGVIVNLEGQILLVEHVFHPRKPWGLPGGWVNHNEMPENAVRREIKEELDLAVEIKSLLMLDLSERNHLDIAYLCTQVGNVGSLSKELLDYRWVNPSELPRLRDFHYQAIQRALETINAGHVI